MEENKYEKLINIINELNNKKEEVLKNLPYHLNVISSAARGKNLKEIAHTMILTDLLKCPKILSSFLNFFFSLDIDINDPLVVKREERGPLGQPDIILLNKHKCIIIENKVNDASEREHQCGRYYLIARTELKTNINIDIDNNIYFLYLKSNDTELPSKDSLMIPDSENELVTNVLKERFIVRSFAYDIRKWLKQLYNELIGSKDEEYLISGIHQYMDYLDFKYETSKIYSTMNNELGKYLELNNYKTIDSLISLREQANDLITTVSNIINMKIFNENKSIIKEIKKIRDGFNKSSNSDEVKEYGIMKKINNIIFCIETDLYDDKIFYGIKCTSDSLDKEIQSKIGELLEHKNTKYSTNLDGGWPIYKYASSKTPEEIYSEFVTFVNDVISSDNSISYNDKDS